MSKRAPGWPCLAAFPAYTPAEIQRGQGMAVRASVTLQAHDFTAPDYELDPYWRTRAQPAEGTFFGRLMARQPYYQGRGLLIQHGYQDTKTGEITWDSTREYVIDTIDGPDSAGKVRIKGRDILAKTDFDRAQYPAPTSGFLNGAIDGTQTSIPLAGLDIAGDYPAPGLVRVEDELVAYTGNNGSSLTGCTRGYHGSQAEEHEDGEQVQRSIEYKNINVVDILYELFRTAAGVDERFLPYDAGRDIPTGIPDEWDQEKDRWLPGHRINHIISEPTRVDELINRLAMQCYLTMWYDERAALVRMSAANTGVAAIDAPALTDRAHLVAGRTKRKEKRHGVITQSWMYFDKRNPLDDDQAANYSSLDVLVDSELESPAAWGNRRIRRLFADWLSGAGHIAIPTNARILAENKSPRYEIELSIDIKDAGEIWTGEFILLSSAVYQRPDGSPFGILAQITKAIEDIPAHRVTLTATVINSPGAEPGRVRYAYIVNTANENKDYPQADQASRDAWAWVAAPAGFYDDEPPYRVQ